MLSRSSVGLQGPAQRSNGGSVAGVMAAIDRSSELAGRQDSSEWVGRLSSTGPERDAAIEELHVLLLRAARFEIRRRSGSAQRTRGDDQEDLAQQCADDALVTILGKLDDFRGDSRFTTWAYKFALYEAAATIRKRAWRDREIPLETEAWGLLADRRSGPQADAEMAELLSALRDAITSELTVHQREVLVALALNEVPIDVLADRLNTTRGALYKTLHDARQKLRAALAAHGMGLDEYRGQERT
jgi:RNA polymerase sigma-70 factor (ECF subfamily)